MNQLLLVEDDLEICEVIQFFLLERPDYNLTIAHSAEQALPLAKLRRFDLILLDVMLPGMDGIDLCGELRRTTYCLILFISCISDDSTIVRALDMGENVILLGAGVQAIDYASWLLNKGIHVQIVHEGTFDEVDKEQSVWFQNFTKAHLCAKGVKIWNGAAVNSIEEDGILITTDFGAEKKLTCDTVIECYGMQPNTDLAEELKAAGYEVYTVGDCASPYNIQKAILSGNLAGRAV